MARVAEMVERVDEGGEGGRGGGGGSGGMYGGDGGSGGDVAPHSHTAAATRKCHGAWSCTALESLKAGAVLSEGSKSSMLQGGEVAAQPAVVFNPGEREAPTTEGDTLSRGLSRFLGAEPRGRGRLLDCDDFVAKKMSLPPRK